MLRALGNDRDKTRLLLFFLLSDRWYLSVDIYIQLIHAVAIRISSTSQGGAPESACRLNSIGGSSVIRFLFCTVEDFYFLFFIDCIRSLFFIFRSECGSSVTVERAVVQYSRHRQGRELYTHTHTENSKVIKTLPFASSNGLAIQSPLPKRREREDLKRMNRSRENGQRWNRETSRFVCMYLLFFVCVPYLFFVLSQRRRRRRQSIGQNLFQYQEDDDVQRERVGVYRGKKSLVVTNRCVVHRCTHGQL